MIWQHGVSRKGMSGGQWLVLVERALSAQRIHIGRALRSSARSVPVWASGRSGR